MSRVDLLQKAHWRHFLDLPAVYEMSMPALVAADSFFEFLAARGIGSPSPSDYAGWALSAGSEGAPRRLEDLQRALEVCFPGHTIPLADARAVIAATTTASVAPAGRGEGPEKGKSSGSVKQDPDWDPIAPPARRAPVGRRVSVPPWELPDDWQATLRQAATGMPLNGVSVAQSIVKRIREKLCQLVFSARRAGVPATLDAEVVEQFIQDLRSRLLKQKNGLRWATMRATAEELYRFSRMIGAPEEEQRRLARLLGECTSRERLQMALKHFAILDSGHTTDTVLDLAESLLTASSSLTTPLKRHRMRNAACIVGLYPVAPLRNASAALVFGQSLFWRNGEWMIETRIQKTAQYNARTFVMPLEPETGRFIDAVVLGDAPIMMLPALRERVQETERPLFVLPDGRPAAPSYIPRVFKAVTGISLTSTRSLLYTDEMNQNGPAGVESARVACHHDPKSRMTDTYRLGSVSVHAVARLRARKSERRRAMLASVSGDARGEN